MTVQQSERTERVAFVGVGRMGAAMLERVLEAGYQAVLCDRSERALSPFVANWPEQVRVAATPRQAAEGCEIVEVVVNTDAQLLDACHGEEGIFAGAAAGTVVLVHSTIAHRTLFALSQAASERSIHLLDATVSGPQGHLSIPNLTVMVGGDPGAFERVKPVLSTYGSLVVHLGGQGAGLDAKLALNLLRYLCMVAAQEATQLARSTGIGPMLAKLVAHSEANRFIGELPFSRIPEPRRLVDAQLSQKDLRAAVARAAEVGLALPSTEFAVGMMHRLWGVESLDLKRS